MIITYRHNFDLLSDDMHMPNNQVHDDVQCMESVDSDNMEYSQKLVDTQDLNADPIEDNDQFSQVFVSGIIRREGSNVDGRFTKEARSLAGSSDEDSCDPQDYNDGQDNYLLLPDACVLSTLKFDTLNLSSDEERELEQNYTVNESHDCRELDAADSDPPDPGDDDDSDDTNDTDSNDGDPNGDRPPGPDPGGDDEPDDPDDGDPDDDGPGNESDTDEERPDDGDDDENRGQAHLLQLLAEGISGLRASTQVGHFVAERIYHFIVEYKGIIQRLRRYPKSYKTLRRKADKKLPPIHIKMKLQDLESGEIFDVEGEKFERGLYGNPMRYKLLETWTTVTLEDALTCLDSWHGRDTPVNELPQWRDDEQPPVEIDLSWDGVEADKKKDKVLEVFSMRSVDCNRVVALSK